MTDELRIMLLGGLEITLGGASITVTSNRKSLALLGYLATTGRPHTREALSTLLWGETSEKLARASLRTALWDLRQGLAPFLTSDRQTVAFNQESSHWLDVVEFERRLETNLWDPAVEAERGVGSKLIEDRVSTLEEAVSLYRGDFLAGFHVSDALAFEEWMVRRRERVRQLAIQALDRLIVHYTAQGAYRVGIDAVNRLLAIAPWQEEAHRQLMLLLALSGQRGAALAQYDTCRRVLAEELDVEPTVETQLLCERIRAGEQFRREAEQGPPSPNLHLVSPRHNLPPQVTSLVGRDDELTELKRMLLDQTYHLVTLAGLDGVGKTHLALTAAEQMAADFDEGAWFVPLVSGSPVCERQSGDSIEAHSGSEFDAGANLVLDIARPLGIRLSAGLPPATQLLDYLRHRDILVVLDGLERSPATTDLIRNVLRSAPYVRILALAQDRIGAEGEKVLHLAGLPVPAIPPHERIGSEGLRELAAYGSVRLFVEQARRVVRGFELTVDNACDVAQICTLAAGLPLAIKLAAALVDECSPPDIVRGVQRDLKRLAIAEPCVPRLRRGMRAVLAYAWRTLPRIEQVNLAHLTVFEGEFSERATLDVANVRPTHLDVLVERCLLCRPACGRYAWHPLIRRFAMQKLEEMTRTADVLPDLLSKEALRERHGVYYLDYVAQREAAIHGPEPQSVSAAIKSEWREVRRAWHWAVGQGWVDALSQSLNGLSRFLLQEGAFWEGERLFGVALGALDTIPRGTENADLVGVLGRLLTEQARFLNEQGRCDTAEGAAKRAINLARDHQRMALGEGLGRSVEAAGRREWGKALWPQGDYAAAKAQLRQALAWADEAGDVRARADSLRYIGLIALQQENYEEAQNDLEQALSLYRDVGDRWGESDTLNHLGTVDTDRHRYGEAQSHLKQALHLCQTIGHRRGEDVAQNNLGRIASMRGDHAAARDHLERALQIARDIHDEWGKVGILTNLGLLFLHEGRSEAAWVRSLLAVELARVLGDRAGEGRALVVLGHTFLELEMYAQAVQAYEQALALHRTLGQFSRAMESLAGLAGVGIARGDLDQAQGYVEEILNHLKESGLQGASDPLRVYLACYQCLCANEDRRAEDILSAASSVFEDLGRSFRM